MSPVLLLFVAVKTLTVGMAIQNTRNTNLAKALSNGKLYYEVISRGERESSLKNKISSDNPNAGQIIRYPNTKSFKLERRKIKHTKAYGRTLKQIADPISRRHRVSLEGRHPWYNFRRMQVRYDKSLYKKQLANKEPEVDDEPYIVLPPDNTINTNEEAFKLDDATATTAEPLTVASLKVTTEAPKATTMAATLPTTLPTAPPSTTPTTTAPTTTPTTITTATPPTTKQTTRAQVISIEAGAGVVEPVQRRAFQNNVTNINLNLEIGEASESEPHESVPMTPTPPILPITPMTQLGEPQPSPRIIIARMAPSSQQQPQIIMAADPAPPPPPQYIMQAPQSPAAPAPVYIAAPPPPLPPPPEVISVQHQAPPAPVVVSAPQPAPPPPAVVTVPQPALPPPAVVSVQQPQPVLASLTAPAPPPVLLAAVSPPRTLISAPSAAVAPLNLASPPSQVTIAAPPPAAITVSSSAPQATLGNLNNMMMPYMGLPPMPGNPMPPFLLNRLLSQGNPYYPMDLGGLSMLQATPTGMNYPWSPFQLPLAQQLQLAQQSPLNQLSSLMLSRFLPLSGLQPFPSPLSTLPLPPSVYDPQLYNSITSLFSNAIRSSLVQSQPNALASALALAAGQAQARNQPPDVLTAALIQALAQNMQQNVQPISNDKLVQALSQALSQVRQTTPSSAVAPPPPQPPPPAPPPQTNQPYQVIPAAVGQPTPIRDSRADSASNGYSVTKVGKALAKALIKAAKKIARQSENSDSDKDKIRHFHRNTDFDRDHYQERSFVPFLYPRSFVYPTLGSIAKKRRGDEIEKYFAMFRPFWKQLRPLCHGGLYLVARSCNC